MILLSFDIEEFDMPFEYNKSISFEEQIEISVKGTTIILDLLKKYHLKATFFSTATFAINATALIARIVAEGHEIASHNYYHSDFKVAHLQQSREKLEEITQKKVIGFRMPRMHPVDEKEIFKAGYKYNSSINPCYLPGRYNNFNQPRTYFIKDKVWQFPASVSPVIRFPLFWLSFHNLPLFVYKKLCASTLKKDGYLNLYFHPWEFTDLTNKTKFGFPSYVSKNTGQSMAIRFEKLIIWMKSKNYNFSTIESFYTKETTL